MWFDYDTLHKSRDRFLRHWCDQNDHLKYQWTYHDGENFGIEDIQDKNLQLNLQWMKYKDNWTTRLDVTPQV